MMNVTISGQGRYRDWMIAAIFFTAIGLPLVLSCFSRTGKVSLTENRALAKAPGIPTSLAAVRSFPHEFETYFNDHFGLREEFVRMNNRLKTALRDSSSPNVLLGKNGWLFLKGENYFAPVRDYQNLDRFTDSELRAYSASIVDKYNWLKARGVAYLYVVVPNKHTVYSDMMPSDIKKQGSESALTQLMTELKKTPQVPVLDLRKPLFAKKATGAFPLYDKFDTHWNTYGANIGQYEILKEVNRLLPGKIVPKLYGDDEFFSIDCQSADLARMLGDMEDRIRGHRVPCVALPDVPHEVTGVIGPLPHVITCPSGKLSAIIYRDSFFSYLQSFVTPYFRKAKYITQYQPAIADIDREVTLTHPDIVIEELAERVLPVKLRALEKIPPAFEEKLAGTSKTVYAISRQSSFIANGLTLTSQGGKDALGLESTGTDPQLILTGLPFTPGKKYILDISIRSDHDTYLQIFWTPHDPPHNYNFSEPRSLRQPITRGTNHYAFIISEDALGENLRIDPGGTPGQFIVNQLHILEL